MQATKINMFAQFMKFLKCIKSKENTVGKGGNAGYQKAFFSGSHPRPCGSISSVGDLKTEMEVRHRT